MQSTSINRKELNQLRASTYIISNGIRKQRRLTNSLFKAFYIQTIIALTLGVFALVGWHNYQVAHSRLNQTQDQLRYEAGQAASFKAWYDKNCVQTYNEDVCKGA